MNIYKVRGEHEDVFVLADSFQLALRKWQKWVIDQSEGMMSMLDPPEPMSLECITHPYDTVL